MAPASDLPPLLDHALDLAQQAGQRILAVYQSDFAVTHKEDASPLTQADLASHTLIVETLARLAPRLPCLSEEAADIPYATRRAWPRYWLVDPLDGTREFVKRNGEFTVNIALVEDHRPVLGVIHAPVLGLTWGAARGAGAFRLDGAKRVSIATRRVGTPLTCVASRSHRTDDTDLYIRKFATAEIVSVGSSLKFCMIAAGKADLYPRFGRIMEWDTAAGDAVLRAAGGITLTLDGTPLTYGKRGTPGVDDFVNPPFIAKGRIEDLPLKI